MGSWGYKALESDEGLDVMYDFQEYVKEHKAVILDDFLEFLRAETALGKSRDDIDFYYDNTLMVIAELYTTFKENGKIMNGDEVLDISSFSVRIEPDGMILRSKVLNFLIEGLDDIYNSVPDESGSREYSELNREGRLCSEWEAHILKLKEKLFHEQKVQTLVLMIRKRQGMFVGSKGFHDLAIYLQSYEDTLILHEMTHGYFFDKSQPFDNVMRFHDWVSWKLINKSSSIGWMQMIERYYPEEKQVEKFWELYESYKCR